MGPSLPSYDESATRPSYHPMPVPPVVMPMNYPTSIPANIPLVMQNTSSGKSAMIMHMNQLILTPPAQTEYVNGECPRPDLAKSMTVEGVEYSNLDPGCTIDFCEKCNKKVKSTILAGDRISYRLYDIAYIAGDPQK